MSAWLYLFQQTACSWSLLLTLGLCAGLRKPAPLRLGAAAVGAGTVSLLCAMHPALILRIAALGFVSGLAPLAAWPGIPRCQRRRICLTGAVLMMLTAGCARLLFALGITRTPLVISLFALLPLLARLLPQEKRTLCITLELTHAGLTMELTALVDSGNLLHDPITSLPVIIISQAAAKRIIPYASPGELVPGMRLISVRTIAGPTLMQVFRPHRIRLLLPHGWQTVTAIVGLCPDGYSGFQALIPSSIIPTSQGGMPLCL